MPVIETRVGLGIKRIALATDMSSVSEMATAYARELAAHFSANLTLACGGSFGCGAIGKSGGWDSAR